MDWHPLHVAASSDAAAVSSQAVPQPDEAISEPASSGTLKLPSAPHRMSTLQLQNHLAAIQDPTATVQLPASLVALLLQSVSARLEQAQVSRDRNNEARIAQVNALTDLLREHAPGVSDQLIERTLLRAAASTAPLQEPPDRWELPYGDHAHRTSEEQDHDVGFKLPQRRPNVIDAALDEAMSDSAFDVRSDSASIYSHPAAELPVIEPDKQQTQKHVSITARLLGIKQSTEPKRAVVEPSVTADQPVEASSRSRNSIHGWAAGVLGGSSSKADVESIKSNGKSRKRSTSGSSSVSTASASTTLGTSTSSHPVDPAAKASPPPSVASTSLRAPKSAVTNLISKKQVGQVLSVPVHAVPALSNPSSVQNSPMLSTFPANSSRASSLHVTATDFNEGESVKSTPASRAMSISSSALEDPEEEAVVDNSSTQGFGRYLGFMTRKARSTSAVVQPTVTLPTLGSTTSKPIFQPSLTASAFASGTTTGLSSTSANANAAASTVELNTISGSRPPAFTSSPDPEGMDQLVDRYGFLHEKNGMKVYRELRQRQQDGPAGTKELSADNLPDLELDGPASLRRLVSQLDEMNEGQEKAQVARWDEFLKKRRANLSLAVQDSSPARRERPIVSSNSKSGAALATTASAVGEEELWSDNMIGIARMGISGKAGKEAWKEFKKLVRTGIPIAYRGSVWAELSGATEAKEPSYYEEMLQKHIAAGDSPCFKQINADVGRTFGSNSALTSSTAVSALIFVAVYFGGDGPGVDKLRKVLIAYSWHNPEVGYCQGMNLLAGTLLLALPSEEDAFWILVCIIERILPSDYFTPSLLVSRADQRVLKTLVSRYLPQIGAHLDKLEVELEAVTFGWFLSLFSLPLPIRTLLRVLDVFFCDGTIVLFRVALAVLQLNSAEILSVTSPSDMYILLRTMTSSLHQADKLVRVACDFKVKTKEVIALREQYVQELQSV